ncbi:MAG: signal peptidase I [Phormidesmis priestleyi Ana]|uniref:Signal peptidase I n=1 Tax=Phormidesmis priestleyi Ana TaxID=1666911 RepID=A0A0P8DHY5_9CYAN|nr:MAG: signal peptidase I [Phormidesmis priestleyi Ana]
MTYPQSDHPSGRQSNHLPNHAAAKSSRLWVEVLQTMGLSIVLALGMRQFVAEARLVPTGSMEPTVQINDRLVIDKISYLFRSPQRGDIIVFQAPEKALVIAGSATSDAYLKRIVGLPGETVEITGGYVLINGKAIEERYIKAPPNYNWGPEVVPEEQYLVLGDNRNGSLDGHVWGFLPEETIIGKAAVRFWPPHRLGGLD